jgi:hypothetical protein
VTRGGCVIGGVLEEELVGRRERCERMEDALRARIVLESSHHGICGAGG